MDSSGKERPAWFVGDLGDPFVAAIGDKLPARFDRRDADAEIPETWVDDDPTPGLVVLHRPILTATDASRVARLRARAEPPARVILCVGPHARHDDLARWGRLFDVVLPEATAAETIRRHVEPVARPSGPRPPVHLISNLHDHRDVLRDLCRHAGYRAEVVADVPEITPRGLVVWDVPTLDPGWPDRMARRTGSAAVVALLGFADRPLVTAARKAGASACLEWPCDIDDLAYVLDRLASTPRALAVEPGHALPPTPAGARRPIRAEVARRARPA